MMPLVLDDPLRSRGSLLLGEMISLGEEANDGMNSNDPNTSTTDKYTAHHFILSFSDIYCITLSHC